MSPLNITQPLGIWSIMATIRWCPIAPKMDIYQSLLHCHWYPLVPPVDSPVLQQSPCPIRPPSSEGGLTSRCYPKWSANGPRNDSDFVVCIQHHSTIQFMVPISSYSVRLQDLKDWVTPWKGELTSWGKDNPGMSVFNPDLVRLRNHLQENCFSQVLVPDHKRRSE